jgi:hypothetical protein
LNLTTAGSGLSLASSLWMSQADRFELRHVQQVRKGVQVKGSRLGTELFDAAQDVAEILARSSVLGHASNVTNQVGCELMSLICEGRRTRFLLRHCAFGSGLLKKSASRGVPRRMERFAMKVAPSELAKCRLIGLAVAPSTSSRMLPSGRIAVQNCQTIC